jgi:hypothetical protein
MTKLYIMINLPRFWFVKIGISKDVKTRSRTITRSMPGRAVPIVVLPLFNARIVEGFLKRALKAHNTPLEGSGYTEWFWFYTAPVAFVVAVGVFFLELCAVVGMFYVLASMLELV